MSYKSVAAPCEREKVIEKSRFLTYAAHTAGEEEARAFLASVRAQHPLATHVCYAFIADRLGNLQRFSDDGEPQGTAGMPILNVIKDQARRGRADARVFVLRGGGALRGGKMPVRRLRGVLHPRRVSRSQRPDALSGRSVRDREPRV